MSMFPPEPRTTTPALESTEGVLFEFAPLDSKLDDLIIAGKFEDVVLELEARLRKFSNPNLESKLALAKKPELFAILATAVVPIREYIKELTTYDRITSKFINLFNGHYMSTSTLKIRLQVLYFIFDAVETCIKDSNIISFKHHYNLAIEHLQKYGLGTLLKKLISIKEEHFPIVETSSAIITELKTEFKELKEEFQGLKNIIIGHLSSSSIPVARGAPLPSSPRGANDVAFAAAVKESSNTPFVINSRATLNANTAHWGFRCNDVASDGNCFFHAVVHQLQIQDIPNNWDHTQLRQLAFTHIRKHKTSYAEWIEGDFDIYIQNNSQVGVYADHVMMAAMARVLNMTLVIVGNDDVAPRVIKPAGLPVETLYIGYETGREHYQSLIPKEARNSTKMKKIIDSADPLQNLVRVPATVPAAQRLKL